MLSGWSVIRIHYGFRPCRIKQVRSIHTLLHNLSRLCDISPVLRTLWHLSEQLSLDLSRSTVCQQELGRLFWIGIVKIDTCVREVGVRVRLLADVVDELLEVGSFV
jgi:hypothetical protein